MKFSIHFHKRKKAHLFNRQFSLCISTEEWRVKMPMQRCVKRRYLDKDDLHTMTVPTENSEMFSCWQVKKP